MVPYSFQKTEFSPADKHELMMIIHINILLFSFLLFNMEVVYHPYIRLKIVQCMYA